MAGKRILVVDDEKKIVDIVKAYLEREGFQVSVAYDGKDSARFSSQTTFSSDSS